MRAVTGGRGRRLNNPPVAGTVEGVVQVGAQACVRVLHRRLRRVVVEQRRRCCRRAVHAAPPAAVGGVASLQRLVEALPHGRRRRREAQRLPACRCRQHLPRPADRGGVQCKTDVCQKEISTVLWSFPRPSCGVLTYECETSSRSIRRVSAMYRWWCCSVRVVPAAGVGRVSVAEACLTGVCRCLQQQWDSIRVNAVCRCLCCCQRQRRRWRYATVTGTCLSAGSTVGE